MSYQDLTLGTNRSIPDEMISFSSDHAISTELLSFKIRS